MIRRLWDAWFADAIGQVEADATAFRESPAGRAADWKTITVLLTTAVCLTIQNYASSPARLASVLKPLIGKDGEDWLRQLDRTQLAGLTWWGGCAVLTYAAIPALVITLGFRERLADYGTKFRGVLSGWPIYVVFVAVMVPLVWGFSAEERFQQTYPFYNVTSRTEIDADFLRWELVYAAQFVALEFFFRGFIVHGTKHRFGVYSVFVMTVPYCMIHYGKPLPEATASIVAGVALGLMSLKTKSVWLGAALHISVAWGMDTATLLRRGLLG